MLRLTIPALAAAAFSASAQAQNVCLPRDDLVNSLAHRFSEEPVSQGLTADGNMLEIFAAPNGSWTLVVTLPSKVSCVRAAGDHWSDTRPAKGEQKAKLSAAY